MTAPTLRPRSATEIVDAAFQILRAHFGQFVMCAAIAYVPLLLVQLLVIGDLSPLVNGESADATAAGQAMFRAGLQSFLASWITFTLMSAVLMVCASQAYLGDPVDVGIAVRRVLPRLPQLLVTGLIRFVYLMLGFMLFLFPVLYVVAQTFAVTTTVVLEEAGVVRAFARSAELSTGRKWHILNTLGLAGIIYLVLALGVSLLFGLLGNFVLRTLGGAIATVLVYPVVAITETLLYYDARIQSEGLDIELMTGALGPDAPAATPAR
jgi:hypothetical protein